MLVVGYTSDVHLEFGDAKIMPAKDIDVLVLAGDIMVAEHLKRYPDGTDTTDPIVSVKQELATRYTTFLRHCADQFPHVVMVLGNHEHYSGNFDETLSIIKNAAADIATNIYVLEKSTVEINGVLFVGGSLWTDMDKQNSLTGYHAERVVTDYNKIRIAKKGYRKLRSEDTIREHIETVGFIKRTLDDNNKERPVVVVTHHAPTFESVAPRHRGNSLNGVYASDLSELIMDHPEITAWIHGHMHDPVDYVVGATRVVSNPRGYYGIEVWESILDVDAVYVP